MIKIIKANAYTSFDNDNKEMFINIGNIPIGNIIASGLIAFRDISVRETKEDLIEKLRSPDTFEDGFIEIELSAPSDSDYNSYNMILKKSFPLAFSRIEGSKTYKSKVYIGPEPYFSKLTIEEILGDKI